MKSNMMAQYLLLFKESTKTTVYKVERVGDSVALHVNADELPYELLSTEQVAYAVYAAQDADQGELEVVLARDMDVDRDGLSPFLSEVESFAPFYHAETGEMMVKPVL